MLPFLKEFLHRGLERTLTHGSSTRISVVLLGFGVLLFSFAFTVAIEWFTAGRNIAGLVAALKSWKSWLAAFFGLLAAWLLLFAYSTLEVVYADHQELIVARGKACPPQQIAPTRPIPTLHPQPTNDPQVATHIKQSGNGNTSNPGTNTGPINQGPCGVIQNGGNNNVAAPICAPSDRRLTEEQTKALVETATAICPFPRLIPVTASNANQEAQRYAIDFVNALKRGGCRTDLALPIPGVTPDVVGVNFAIRGRQGLEAKEITLVNTLRAHGITVGIHPLADGFFPDEKFVIVIGARD